MKKPPNRLATDANNIGAWLVNCFHYLALFAIGSVIVWSATLEFIHQVSTGSATIEGILLLFIYLELGAMVGIYFQTKRMPVRFLFYVAITALTRLMVDIIQASHDFSVPLPVDSLIKISAAILILAVATLIIRFGSYRFPSTNLSRDSGETPDDV
ncbi:MAG: phosphate-starvation-inducible protein PsiE [Gammaproteobacteria bacterium]|nr:phosphate-starvation-inducible protein PsiE [Gammaproteobacteria bacterium]